MKNIEEPLETLSEIRSMMERSSRFISLNGLSGVFSGIFALIGAYVGHLYLNQFNHFDPAPEFSINSIGSFVSTYFFFFMEAFLVLMASIFVALLLSITKARKNGLTFWDNTAKRLLINLLIPLITGGLFCLILLMHGIVGLVAPVMLIFYGLALINASKYTYNDIRFLGLIEVLIGLLASVWTGYGLIFWAIGFGIIHIIYGVIMYFKYER